MISRKASLVLCALLLGGQIVFLLSRPRPETLLERAAPIMLPGNSDGSGSAYFWRPNNELLVLRRAWGGVEAVRYDPAKGFVGSADGLAKTLADTGVIPARARDLRPSPDGKWLLWPPAPGSQTWSAARVADGRRLEWESPEKVTDDGQGFWMPDGRRWVEMLDADRDTRLRVRGIDNAGAAGAFEIRHGFLVNHYRHLGFLDATRAIGVGQWVGDGAVGVAEYAVTPNPPSGRFFLLKAPPDAYGPVEAALSPGGDRLAWRFEHKPPPFGLTFFNGTALGRSFEPSRVGLWVSRIDGGDMRLIGFVNVGTGAMEMLRWTPDGKRVSFLHQNQLWSVPAD